MRFIATADLQIGMPLRWLGDAQSRFDQSRIDAILSIADLVREKGAEAVVVGGDLFDRDPVDDDDLVRTMEAIREVPVPVLVLPGNHDSHHPDSVWTTKRFAKERPDNLTLLLDEPVAIGGVEFVGAPLMTRNPDSPTLHDRLATLDPDGSIRVVVGHGAVWQVVGDHGNDAAFDLDIIDAALEDGRASFVVLGDRHSTLSVGASGRVWYPGAPEPTDFGDDAGHVLVVDLAEDGGASVTTHQTGTWRFVLLEPEVADADDVAALLAEIADLPRKTSTNLKVRPSGILPLDAYRALEAGLADAGPRFGSVQAIIERIALLPDADEVAALDLPPYARRVLEELLGESAADPDDEDVRAQLNLFIRTAREVGA
jgi:DNA repair exonuclease SbcCD nuclease subunit